MAVSAFATAVIATVAAAAVASATATFTAHHLHQFLNFFVGSRTAFDYFTFKDQVSACQWVVKVNYYYIRFDFYDAGVYALTVSGHQRYNAAFCYAFAVELAIYFKDIFRKIKYMLLIVGSVSFICRNGKIEFITVVIGVRAFFWLEPTGTST